MNNTTIKNYLEHIKFIDKKGFETWYIKVRLLDEHVGVELKDIDMSEKEIEEKAEYRFNSSDIFAEEFIDLLADYNNFCIHAQSIYLWIDKILNDDRKNSFEHWLTESMRKNPKSLKVTQEEFCNLLHQYMMTFSNLSNL